MRILQIGVSLGDPYHDPLREDPIGTRQRIQTAIDFLDSIREDQPIIGWWDEDYWLAIPITDTARREAAKSNMASCLDDGTIVEWNIDRVGRYDLYANEAEKDNQFEAIYQPTRLPQPTVDTILGAAFPTE